MFGWLAVIAFALMAPIKAGLIAVTAVTLVTLFQHIERKAITKGQTDKQ